MQSSWHNPRLKNILHRHISGQRFHENMINIFLYVLKQNGQFASLTPMRLNPTGRRHLSIYAPYTHDRSLSHLLGAGENVAQCWSRELAVITLYIFDVCPGYTDSVAHLGGRRAFFSASPNTALLYVITCTTPQHQNPLPSSPSNIYFIKCKLSLAILTVNKEKKVTS